MKQTFSNFCDIFVKLLQFRLHRGEMMYDAKELPELPYESLSTGIVAHWIERHGKATPVELVRRAAAARRAGNHEEAANFVELAKAAQAVLLSVHPRSCCVI